MNADSRPLTGRHALVTGASRGIGAAIRHALEVAGATVTGLSLRGTAGCLACDITDPTQVAQAFATARASHGPIHYLINNAGHAVSGPFGKASAEQLQEMLAVHVEAPWHCTQAALPDLLACGDGRIVNVASIAGQKGYPYVAAYCTAKHALIGLTRALAAEFAGKGLTVNAVCPGYTDTDLVLDAVQRIAHHTGRSEADARATLAARNPQGRLIAPEEVAAAVVWLCSPHSAALNGQSLSLSGGEITP